MAKTRVSFSISDTELEKTLSELMTKRVQDFCEDSIKNTVDKAFDDKFAEAISEQAEKRLQNRYKDYSLDALIKAEVQKVVRSNVMGVWGDISEELQKTIDDAVHKALDDGRYEAFIEYAIKEEFGKFVQRIVTQTYTEKE